MAEYPVYPVWCPRGSYCLGVVLTFLALIIGFFRPAAGVLGDITVIVTGITTLSLLPQLGKIDSFIIKDVLLIGAGAVLLVSVQPEPSGQNLTN